MLTMMFKRKYYREMNQKSVKAHSQVCDSYWQLKALQDFVLVFVLFKFLSWRFGPVEKWLDLKD